MTAEAQVPDRGRRDCRDRLTQLHGLDHAHARVDPSSMLEEIGMRPLRVVGVLGCVAAAFLPVSAEAAEIAIVIGKDRGAFVSVSGKINHGDAERLDTALDLLHDRDIPLIAVGLKSPGGYLVDGLAMADVVRKHGAATFAYGTCASACFIVFAAGSEKMMTSGARLGVHTAYEPGGVTSRSATTVMAETCARYGVPASVVAKMERTPAPGVAWLTRGEEKAMGVRKVRLRPPG
jgi:hypothetical protein